MHILHKIGSSLQIQLRVRRFFTTEIDIAHITNITHEHNYNLKLERREMLLSRKKIISQDSNPASCITAGGGNHYAIPHPPNEFFFQ